MLKCECIQLSELYIEEYKGIRNLKLEELGKINIVTGVNNVGKTRILEKIVDLKDTKELKCNVIKYESLQRLDSINIEAILNNAELHKGFITVLREFDPQFISVNISETKKWIVYSGNSKEGVQLDACGSGMKSVVALVNAILQAENGILLIDDFEMMIHVSIRQKVISWIMNIAKEFNVQIFMISHSIEAIKVVLQCIDSLKDIRVITLVKANTAIKARNVDGEKAIQLLEEYGLELR